MRELKLTELPADEGTEPSYVSTALMASGYLEREFLIEGIAGVYGPGDPTASGGMSLSRSEIVPLGQLARADVPYMTRVLVRAPADPARFSGTVVIEPMHNTGEMVPSWSASYRHHLHRGHAWIGVTVSSGPSVGIGGAPIGGTDLLRHLNPGRYGTLHLEPGDPADWPLLRYRDDTTTGLMDVLAESPFTGKSKDASGFGVMMEEIYRTYAHSPDIVAQLAMKLKNEGLDGRPVVHLIGTGASGTSSWWNAFIIGGHHDRAPVFDGYLLYVCLPPPVRPSGAVLVNVNSEAEALAAVAVGDVPPPDTEDPPFRQYELPGTGHRLSGDDEVGVTDALSALTSTLDQNRPAGLLPYDRVNFPLLHGIWRALERGIEDGSPLPPSRHIIRNPFGEGGLARDRHGNALGGLRPPWVDVPNAQYRARSPWNPLRACMTPFGPDRMHQLYGDVDSYRAAFSKAVDELVVDGWVSGEDAADFDPGGF